MTISRTTRTHLIYQFIILTLLFLGIGYNELLPGRKFILFLAFMPMFCYQLVILSCCMELLPVPSWMTFCESSARMIEMKTENAGTDSFSSSPAAKSPKQTSQEPKRLAADFADLSERIHEPRRWEKSSVNLGTTPKHLTYPQKSKSWMNLSDSTKSVMEASLSREGSLDILTTSNRKLRSSHALSKIDRAHYKEQRANKAKSWKPSVTDFGTPCRENAVDIIPTEVETKIVKPPLTRVSNVKQDESELAKSYSFPFRQKRLETWLEMKETETRESNQSLDMPYWKTLGYDLAVKYEARRRRRAVSSPTRLESTGEVPLQAINLQKSVEMPKDTAHNIRQMQKKSAKSASYCINKIKTSFSNLISKKKDDIENVSANPNRVLKPTLSFRNKNKNVSYQPRTGDKVTMPEFPQFLSTERPLIFYPKYIPFEKERFENDVQNKMVELLEEQKGDLKRFQNK